MAIRGHALEQSVEALSYLCKPERSRVRFSMVSYSFRFRYCLWVESASNRNG